MDRYTALRHFADSWGVVLMLLFLAGVVAWIFRPGARKQQDDAARMIFRNEDEPKPLRKDHDDGQ